MLIVKSEYLTSCEVRKSEEGTGCDHVDILEKVHRMLSEQTAAFMPCHTVGQWLRKAFPASTKRYRLFEY